MQKIHLKDGCFALVDDEDYSFLSQWSWRIHNGSKRGKTFYASRTESVNGKTITILMHRVLLNLTDSNIMGDHIDRNGLNNQKNNLRLATKSQNNANRAAKINGTSKYLGVSKDKNRSRYRACITFNNKSYKLGSFRTQEEAAMAYDKKALEVHGEFANLNFKNSITNL